jgi:1-deoxy-D-xylulose-5-phosphate synthase
MVSIAVKVHEILKEEGVQSTVVNARFAKPIETDFLRDVCEGKKLVVTLEDNVTTGGFGSAVSATLREAGIEVPVLIYGLPDRYVDHGTIEELFKEVGLSPSDIAAGIRKQIENT